MNVMFKRGTQKSLLNYINGTTAAVEGSFYLTTDTNRLYIGKVDPTDNKVKAVPVNQGVINVNSFSELQAIAGDAKTAGQFYYLTNTNILCVHNGTEWVQINPDNNTYVTERTTAGGTGTVTIDQAEISYVAVTDTVVQQKEKGGALDPAKENFVGKFAVYGDNGVNVTIDTFKDGTVDRPIIKISQDAYTLTSETLSDGSGAKLTLSDGHSTDVVTLKGGDNVSFDTTDPTDDTIVIKSKNTTLSEKAGDNKLEFTAAGALKFTVKDTDSHIATASVTPQIKYAPNDQGTAEATAKFGTDGTLVLDVYSTSQINERLRGLDAMVYKGTVGENGSVSALPGIADNISVGDTYKFIATDVVNGTNVKPGDVVIARGTEGTDGFIASGLTWDIIPSGDDALSDTTYWTQSITAGTQLMENQGGVGAPKGGIQLLDKKVSEGAIDTYLTIENDPSVTVGANNVINKVVIKHKEQEGITAAGKTAANTDAVTQNKSYDLDIPIPVLSYDKAGHITKIESKTYTVRDTKFEYDLEYLKTASASTTVTGSTMAAEATISASLRDVDALSSDVVSFKIHSSSISLNQHSNGTDLVMDIEWGSF